MDLEVVVEARAKPGEGPHWDEQERVLWWVDINGCAVHRFDPATGADRSTSIDREVGVVVPRKGGGLIAGVRDGFGLVDFEAGALEMLHTVPPREPRVRMNDGKCDAAGRLWAGTMAFDASPGAGALYRLDPDLSLTEMVTGVTISNGIGWSLDGRSMYYIDSRAYSVDVFDFDVDAGSIANRRTLVDVARGSAVADGMCVDAEGCLWVAYFRGSCVRRYTPSGELERTIDMPVTQVTSCAFGGDDFGDLYITTAATRLTDEQLAQQPLAGSLFRCRPDVTGLPANRFGG